MNNTPNPALVTRRAAARLPRLALLLFCAAYLLPGLFGRDPWKNADITAFGYMRNIANGLASPWAPTLAGLPGDGGLLPYWIGALFIKLLGPWLGAPLAARLPFALLLAGVLALTWYATYYLARTEAAQPVAFAFGGEAGPVDYARAIADGALLALIATLGLLQLGHETTPELVQLFAAGLFLYALAAASHDGWRAGIAMLLALPMLALSGAPSMALMLTGAGAIACFGSSDAQARSLAWWTLAAGVVAALLASGLSAWAWRLGGDISAPQIVRLLAWFTWPAWPFAAWALWRWRQHLWRPHIAVPLGTAAVGVAACVAMGGSDRALLLALPALAVLAAFALPTMARRFSALIDWFSVFFFSACALYAWVVYAAMQTGTPARQLATVQRLAPGFKPSFSALALLAAALASAAWIALVQWRTGRHRHPLWKSMVLPASGVALCWLLTMTLWLPPLDYARSYRPLVERIARYVPHEACIAAPGQPRSLLAALEFFGGYRVEAREGAAATRCEFLVINFPIRSMAPSLAGWRLLAREQQPTDREEATAIFRRVER